MKKMSRLQINGRRDISISYCLDHLTNLTAPNTEPERFAHTMQTP